MIEAIFRVLLFALLLIAACGIVAGIIDIRRGYARLKTCEEKGKNDDVRQ